MTRMGRERNRTGNMMQEPTIEASPRVEALVAKSLPSG